MLTQSRDPSPGTFMTSTTDSGKLDLISMINCLVQIKDI